MPPLPPLPPLPPRLRFSRWRPLASALAAISTVALLGGGADADRRRARHPTIPFERVDRCAVRLLSASAEARAALEAHARASFAGAQVEWIQLTRYGERVRVVRLDGAPAADPAPASEADAVAEVRRILMRHRGLFGLDRRDVAAAELSTYRTLTTQPWRVYGKLPGGTDVTQIIVELTPSGALRSIKVEEAVPAAPPGAVCERGRVSLDDPRIHAAIDGQLATLSTGNGPRIEKRLAPGDVRSVTSEVQQTERDVFRRVIVVDVGAWHVYLDADTTELRGIIPTVRF